MTAGKSGNRGCPLTRLGVVNLIYTGAAVVLDRQVAKKMQFESGSVYTLNDRTET